MKTLSLLATAVLVTGAGISGCKKAPGAPDEPACSASQSILASRTVPLTNGPQKIVCDEDGLSSDFRRLGPDTLLVTRGTDRTYFVFDSRGDQYLTQTISDDPAAGPFVTNTFFAYDAEHRVLRRWRYTSASKNVSDSTSYNWVEGNLISEYDHVLGRTVASYEYNGDGRGQNPGNVPSDPAQWLYRRGTTVRLSKDYVRRSGESRLTPGFDGQGRLVRLERSEAPGNPFTFTYRCR